MNDFTCGNRKQWDRASSRDAQPFPFFFLIPDNSNVNNNNGNRTCEIALKVQCLHERPAAAPLRSVCRSLGPRRGFATHT